MTLKNIHLPCGSRARWDTESEMGYRCMDCFAMVGSVGQPQHCQEAAQMYANLKTLGGKGWDYEHGRQQ